MDWTEQIPNIENVSQGTATMDTNQGVGYYLGGRLDETPVARLLSCNLSNWVFQSQLLPLNRFTWAFLQYIPVGKKGILVFFGGKNDATPTVVSRLSFACHLWLKLRQWLAADILGHRVIWLKFTYTILQLVPWIVKSPRAWTELRGCGMKDARWWKWPQTIPATTFTCKVALMTMRYWMTSGS